MKNILLVMTVLVYVECIKIEPYITKGTREANVPYNAYILYVNKNNAGFFGGGSLISSQHVLTAAQNIYGFVKWSVRLGGSSYNHLLVFNTTKAKQHPNYENKNSVLRNDIGIIFLEEVLIFTNQIFPIALPSLNAAHPYQEEQGHVVGFGFTTPEQSQMTENAALMGGYMRMVSDDICRKTYAAIAPYQFCAQDKEEFTNICYGDIGAGLVLNLRNEKVLVGIASTIMRSCAAEEPTGFVRVSLYVDWIKAETGIIT